MRLLVLVAVIGCSGRLGGGPSVGVADEALSCPASPPMVGPAYAAALATPTDGTCVLSLSKRGDAHSCDRRTEIWSSADAGRSWAGSLDVEADMEGWFFADGRAWLTLHRLCAGVLPAHHTSTDHGQTWERVDAVGPDLLDGHPDRNFMRYEHVSFLDAHRGALRGGEVWFLTHDGGASWAAEPNITPAQRTAFERAPQRVATNPACRLREQSDGWVLEQRTGDRWCTLAEVSR